MVCLRVAGNLPGSGEPCGRERGEAARWTTTPGTAVGGRGDLRMLSRFPRISGPGAAPCRPPNAGRERCRCAASFLGLSAPTLLRHGLVGHPLQDLAREVFVLERR